VLIDTTILLDVALDRDPFAEPACRLLDAAQRGDIEAWVAWHTVADFYYLCASDKDDSAARGFLSDLLSFVEVSTCSTDGVRQAFSFRMRDFEDALQCAAAIACRADAIATRNLKDFRSAPVRALHPSDVTSE
jgi:predicted nucleic acid-binding protein